MRLLLSLIAILLSINIAQAQVKKQIYYTPPKLIDSTQKDPKSKAPKDTTHSPKKAAIRSTILPGWGQAYNHKYWKIPVLYGGMGLTGFFIFNNYTNYQKYRKAYFTASASQSTVHIDGNTYNKEQLFLIKDYYRRNMDLSVVILAGIYALNIIDAIVDAHLRDFNISKDLKTSIGIGIDPTYTYAYTPSVKLCISW